MKVTVVTPYYLEDEKILDRCHQSVINQTYADTTHLFVSDGGIKHQSLSNSNLIVLPVSHHDAGATPRSIGAISAFSNGTDAVAFLDADNTFEHSHISLLVDIMQNTRADVVTATRNICNRTGAVLYVDNIESNGIEFCDTNCYLINRSCLHLMTQWVVDKQKQLWSDRFFWQAVKASSAKIAHSTTPTVNYYSKWAWHYRQAGVNIPSDSVWIDFTTDTLKHIKHNAYTIEERK